MSVITPTVAIPVDDRGCNVSGAYLVTWANILAADTCRPWVAPHCSRKSVQVTGVYDSGSIAIHGTNGQCYDTAGTLLTPTFGALSDIEGATLAISSGNLPMEIQENVNGIKPVTTGGGGSSSLTVTMLISSPGRP